MKNVLVIGGSGFIGSNLCGVLVQRGLNVYSYDNYFTGKAENHIDGVTYYTGETINICEVKFPVIFSHIYHFGEYSRVEQSYEDIDLVFKFNHAPIYEVLKFVKLNKAKIIYSGSSTKFADKGQNYEVSPYAWTKRKNTELVKCYADWYGLDYSIAYFYNVYGTCEIAEGKYATLIAKYIKLINEGSNTLPVVSPGTQLRNFTNVKDIISALILIGEKGSGDGYGIGSDESFSILDVVRICGKEVEWLPARTGNRMFGSLVTEKTKDLGWRPKFSLSSYISQNSKH